MELARVMNFTIELCKLEDLYGHLNRTTMKWSGVIGRLIDKKVDIGVADFTMTEERLGVIDYTASLISSRSHLYIKRPDTFNFEWSSYIQVQFEFG